MAAEAEMEEKNSETIGQNQTHGDADAIEQNSVLNEKIKDDAPSSVIEGKLSASEGEVFIEAPSEDKLTSEQMFIDEGTTAKEKVLECRTHFKIDEKDEFEEAEDEALKSQLVPNANLINDLPTEQTTDESSKMDETDVLESPEERDLGKGSDEYESSENLPILEVKEKYPQNDGENTKKKAEEQQSSKDLGLIVHGKDKEDKITESFHETPTEQQTDDSKIDTFSDAQLTNETQSVYEKKETEETAEISAALLNKGHHYEISADQGGVEFKITTSNEEEIQHNEYREQQSEVKNSTDCMNPEKASVDENSKAIQAIDSTNIKSDDSEKDQAQAHILAKSEEYSDAVTTEATVCLEKLQDKPEESTVEDTLLSETKEVDGAGETKKLNKEMIDTEGRGVSLEEASHDASLDVPNEQDHGYQTTAPDGLSEEVGFTSEKDENMCKKDDCAGETAQDFPEETTHRAGKDGEETDAKNIGSEGNDRDVKGIPDAASEEDNNAKTPDNTITKEITIAAEQEDEARKKVSSNNEETEGEKISSVKGESEPTEVEDEYVRNTVGDASDKGKPTGKPADVDDVVDDVHEETIGHTCDEQHQENVESNEKNEDGEQREEEHQTLQQEELVSEVENQETTSTTGANKMEISKEGENLINTISESVNLEETKIEHGKDDKKIKESVEDNPRDHALPSQTIHDVADADHAEANQSLEGKDDNIASLEKESIKSKGPDEVHPSESETHQSLVDKDNNIVSLEKESIESKGPDEVQLGESEATKVAEIVSTTDEAETTSVDGGESVDVDKDKAEYQEHKNVRGSVMEEYNQGEANETQMAKSHEIPEMDDLSPEKASETNKSVMKDIHDKTKTKHEEPDFASNKPINQTNMPEQSRIPEEENTIMESKTESSFPKDAIENALKSDPDEKDEEMLKNEESSHIFPESSPNVDHKIARGLSHQDEGNKICEDAALETPSGNQSREADEEQIEIGKPKKLNELKQDIPMKYFDAVNSQEETIHKENPDNVEESEKCEVKDETALTLERASAADSEEPSHWLFSSCEKATASDGLSEEADFASEKDENMCKKDDCARETAQDFLEETTHRAWKGGEETDAKNIGSEDNDRDVKGIPDVAPQGDYNTKTPDNTYTKEIMIAIEQEDEARTQVRSDNEETEGEKISSVKGDSEPTKVENEYISNTVGDASDTGEPTGKPADVDDVVDDVQEETIGSTCDEQHQENIESNEKNEDGEQREDKHQTLQQEELVSEVENQETTSTTGAKKMEISKEGENLINMISESVNLEETKIENDTDDEKIKESVEDNPRDHALLSQTRHDVADEDHTKADQSLEGKDGNIVSLEKESIKSKGPDEVHPSESEAHQRLVDKDNNIVSLEKESIESKGPDEVQPGESEATKVAEIVSTTDEAETTSVDGGESVDVDKDKAEYQEHKNVIESVMEEYNKGGANETQMAKSHQIPEMDDLSPEKASETNESVMKDMHDKTKTKHEEEPDFASNKPINQTTMPEQSRIPEEENTIMESKTESSFPKDAIENALKSDPEEKDEEMLKNDESSHIFPESSPDADHNIAEGLCHQDEGNKIYEDAAPETAFGNQSCEANEEQRETEKKDMPMKYIDTVNSQEETIHKEDSDNVEESEKCAGEDGTALTLERASAAKDDEQREEKFQNPHDIESEMDVKKEKTTSEAESSKTTASDGLSEEADFASEKDENMCKKGDCARETVQDFSEETTHRAGKGGEETDTKNIGGEDNDRDVKGIPDVAPQGDYNTKTPNNTYTKEIMIAVEQEDEARTQVSSDNEKTEGEKISSVKGDSEPTKVEDEYISNTVVDASDTGEPTGKPANVDDVVDDVQEETIGSICEEQHQENVESNEKNEEGEQRGEEHQTLQQEELVSEVENQETTSTTGAKKMEISKEGENLINMISESVNLEETKIENDTDDEKIKESIEDNPRDLALPSQTIHDVADEDHAEAVQSLEGKDGNIASLEKESIKSKGPDEVHPSESEAHQSLEDKDNNIVSFEKESIESKGPDEIQLSELEGTKVAEIVSTTDEAETTSVDGGESVDVDKDKAEYQEHKNVRESVMEEYNQGEANETQMAKSHKIPEMDDLSPEKASETNESVMKDMHDKTKTKHEEEPDFASNKPINQTTMPEQSRIPEEENTIMESKTESSFPKDAIENALKSDPEEKDEEMQKNKESSHIFLESSPDTDHNIAEGLCHLDEGNKTCEDAAPETASGNQSCEANEEQSEIEKQDMPMKYIDTVNSQEETIHKEDSDNVEESEKCEGKDGTALTLERASAAEDDEKREEKFQNPHDIESETDIKKEKTTSEAESTKVSEPVNVDEDTKIANTMDDESVKEIVEDNPGNNAVPPQTEHNAVGEKPQETEDSSSPHPDKESSETRGLDITEEQVAEVQTAEAEDINAGYIEDKDKPEVPENAGINDDSQTASMKEREDTQIDNSSISDALTEKSNEVPSSFYDEKAHQGTSTKEGNEVDVNEDKTDYQEYNNISESIAEEQNQEKENETELTKNVEVSEMGDITEDPESVKTKDEKLTQENICGFLETQDLVTEEIHDKVDKKHEEVPNFPCENQVDQINTIEENVDYGRNKEKLAENVEAQKESIIVPQEKNQIVVPEEKSRDTISKAETNKIENAKEENTNGDETSGSSFENSMTENNSELALKAEKEEEIPKDEEISHILPETAEVIPEKQILGDDGNYEDPGCTIVEKISHQDESSTWEDAAPEAVLDNQNKEAKENLKDTTREEDVETAAENIKEREPESTENIEEKEVETEIQSSETNEIKDATYEIPKCEEICTHDESTNISHQDEESENKNYKDEGSTFQKIDNTHVTTSLADETALEYSHEDQKELATMADTEMGSMLPRNQKDDSELTTSEEQILEATSEVEPAKDEMPDDQNDISGNYLLQNYKLGNEDSEVENPEEEETTSKIHPTLPEETEEGTETKQEANPNHDEETHEHVIKNNVVDLDTLINGNKSEEPAEASADILKEPSRAITTETGVIAEKGLMEGDVTTSEETNKLVSEDLDPQNHEKVEPPLIRALDEPTVAVTTSEETNKLVSEDLEPQNEKEVESPQTRENALEEQIATPTNLVTTTEPVSTANEDDAVSEESLKRVNQEVKDLNMVSDEHIQEAAETNPEGIQPLQDESTAEDASSTKELKHVLEMSTPAIAPEDQIHQIMQASETTNETILEKENKEYQEVEGNSEAKEMDGWDQQGIKRKQLIGNECEPINTGDCSKEIKDSGATLGVTQDNRNKEEVHKSVETKEMECEKQEEQTATEVFEVNQAIYKDETSKEESDPIGDRIGTSALEFEDKSSYHHHEPMHVDDTIAGMVAKEEVENAAENIKERELETTDNIKEREVETVEIQTSETNEIKDAAYEVPQCDEICTHNESTNIAHQDEGSETVNNKDEGSTFQKIDNTHITTSLADEAALEYLHEDQKELPTMADTAIESRLSRDQENDSELTTTKEQTLEATTEVDTTRDETSENQNYKLANEESEIVNPKEEETTSKIQVVLALPKETKEGLEINHEANPNHGEETHEHVSKNNAIDLDTPIDGNKSEEPAEASAEIMEEQSRAITTETEVVAEKGSMEGEVTTFEKSNKLVSEDTDPQNNKEVESPLIRKRASDEPIVEVSTSEEANKLVPEDLDAQIDKEVESPQIREKATDEPIVTPTNLVTTTEPASTAKEDDAAQEESLKSIDQEVKDFNLVSDEHIQEQAETNSDVIQPLQDAEDVSSTKELKHELEMSTPAIASEDQIHQIKEVSETTNETVLEKENKEYQQVEGDSEAKKMDGQDQEEINRKQLIGKEWEPVNANECNIEIEEGEATLGSIRDNKSKEQEVHKSSETKEMEYEKQEEETATEVIEANQATYKDESSVEESNAIGDRIGTSASEYQNKSSMHNNEPVQVDNTVAGVVAQKKIVKAENEIFEHENQSKNKEPDEELKPKETDATLNENPTDKVNEADATLAEKNIITDEKTKEEIKTRAMNNDFASKEIETSSEYISTNWETVSEALKANIMTLDDNKKDKDVTDKIVHNLGIEKEDTSLVVLSKNEIPEKLSTNEAIDDIQNEKESFPVVDTAQNEDKQQTEQDVLPVSRYLMDRILQEQSGNNDETLEVESEEMTQGKTIAQIADDTIISKREVQDIKRAEDHINLVEEHMHDPEKPIEKSLENNDGIQDNNPCNAPQVVAVDEDVKGEVSRGMMSREKDPEKEVDVKELKSKDLLQDGKIPITGPQVIETAMPKASEEDAPNEGEKCEVEMLSDIPKNDEVANETPKQQTSSLSEPVQDAKSLLQSVEIPQESHCHEADYSTKLSNDKENMPEEASEALPKSVEVDNGEVKKGQISENSVLEVLKVVPEGLKDENGEENQHTITESQTIMTNVDLPEEPEVSDSQNVQKPDTKIESGKETVKLDEKCSENIITAICTEEKQSEKLENAITKEGKSDSDKKDEKKGGDEHKSDDFGHSTYVIVEDSRRVVVENEEPKQDKVPEVNMLEDLETLPKDKNVENEEENRETTTESKTMMTKVNFPNEPEVPDSQKVQKLDTEMESAKKIVEPDEKCSEVVNLTTSTEEKQSEKVISATSEEEKTDDDDEKDGRQGEDEHKAEDPGNNAAVIVEARDVELKPTHKKSHNILSGVGSKVKHSLAKVKKAITGKSSHPKTASPR
ncbi:titin isoform X4 [Ananas comosus]|uniref:Titin isoform X4 n=1 Tax=Ananas comosus TaxID=4615 RepID=A0A6P5FW63_ANACO|nr:titin isoform X4 [Ananas comosus]